MPRIRDFVVQDRRRRTATTPSAPSWEWSTELADSERAELNALRAERDDLRERVEALHVAAQDAHEREEALSALVHDLTTGPFWSRMGAARRARRPA